MPAEQCIGRGLPTEQGWTAEVAIFPVVNQLAVIKIKSSLKNAFSSTRHSSGLVAYSCITQVARNGNLQIEMHSFMSQQLPQR